MKSFTFNVEASVTVAAESEAEAFEILQKCNLEDDVFVGPGGVYFSAGALHAAELTDVFDPGE